MNGPNNWNQGGGETTRLSSVSQDNHQHSFLPQGDGGGGGPTFF